MNFTDAIKTCLIQKYATFSGRARRSEFWFFVLFCFLAGIVVGVLDAALFGIADPATGKSGGPLGLILNLALIVPSWAVAARRLHDLNKSGWWQLIAITIVGIIPLIIWYCTPGKAEDNRFGPPVA